MFFLKKSSKLCCIDATFFKMYRRYIHVLCSMGHTRGQVSNSLSGKCNALMKKKVVVKLKVEFLAVNELW